jgi:hypothetical protein
MCEARLMRSPPVVQKPWTLRTWNPSISDSALPQSLAAVCQILNARLDLNCGKVCFGTSSVVVVMCRTVFPPSAGMRIYVANTKHLDDPAELRAFMSDAVCRGKVDRSVFENVYSQFSTKWISELASVHAVSVTTFSSLNNIGLSIRIDRYDEHDPSSRDGSTPSDDNDDGGGHELYQDAQPKGSSHRGG